MQSQKALWLEPTENDEIDTPQEFISACAKHIKYPQFPEKEKAIAELLINSQRGKVNPIQSDDSILIARSTSATQKKPYINQAAAASVGRSEFIREDVQVSVGLGDNKYNSFAEGFLDSLPLQSLGTDVIFINLRNWEKLSIMVTDWLRDYVIPAASKGPYRRNIVIVTESNELEANTHEDLRWSEWEDRVTNYRILPFELKQTVSLLKSFGFSSANAFNFFTQSLGYPRGFEQCLSEERLQTTDPLDLDEQSIQTLIALATLDEIYLDEVKAVIRHSNPKTRVQNLLQRHANFFETTANGKGYILNTDLKRRLAKEMANREELASDEINRSLPMARLIRNVPKKADRAKLLLLSNLCWMNANSIAGVFEDNADKVSSFVQSDNSYFVSKRMHYQISGRIRNMLSIVEAQLAHSQSSTILEKARNLWAERQTEIKLKEESLNEQLHKAKDEGNLFNRKLHESEVRVRLLEKKSKIDHSTTTIQPSTQKNNGKLILLFSVLAIMLFALTKNLPDTFNYICFISGLASFCVALALIPSWLKYRKIRQAYNGGHDETLEEFMHERDELQHNAQSQEAKITQLIKEIKQTKEQLNFPYV